MFRFLSVSVMKKAHFFSIFIVIIFGGLIAGCSEFNLGGNDTDDLYKELVGTYTLFKAEVTFTGKSTQLLVPPDISGTMTISSDQKITQTLSVLGTIVSVKGSFEILLDEKVMTIDNETSDLISKAIYTWDGSVFTTTLDTGAFIEKDFWRKL